ncbi:MAG: DUF6788 family protein [Anaerolineae bacterium]
MKRRHQLERQRQRLLRSLPPLDGVLRASLFERSRRCGKPGCHCSDGAGHPATYLSVSFAGGKTKQVTLPEELVPVARDWIRNYQRLWQFIEEVSAINRELLRQRWIEPRPRRGRKRSG